jgi:transposase
MNDTLVGVDLAKAVFQVAVSSRPGRFDSHARLTRDQLLPFFAQLPPAIVILEACGTGHFWGRKLRELGHGVVLLPPGQVRPFVRRNKTDRSDAKALVEAYRNGEIRPVPIKTPDQQVLTSLHRLREGWMAQRTARLNALRGLLREQGVFIRVGAAEVVPAVWALIEDADAELAAPLRTVFAEACLEIREIERRLGLVDRELAALARQSPAVERFMLIPGIGLIIATALVGFVGNLHRFPSARHFASYLGLTPRQRPAPTTGPHLQTRRFLSADAAGPRRTIRPEPRPQRLQPRPPAQLGPGPGEQGPSQQGHRRPGQQTRSHRLGRLRQGHRLPLRPGPPKGRLINAALKAKHNDVPTTADCWIES